MIAFLNSLLIWTRQMTAFLFVQSKKRKWQMKPFSVYRAIKQQMWYDRFTAEPISSPMREWQMTTFFYLHKSQKRQMIDDSFFVCTA